MLPQAARLEARAEWSIETDERTITKATKDIRAIATLLIRGPSLARNQPVNLRRLSRNLPAEQY